jgi:MFS family permease
MLALLAGGILFAFWGWMSATAIAPDLQLRWSLTDGQVGLLTTSVQLGFVVGTAAAAVLNLADVVSSRAYFATSSVLAATANAALLVVPGYRSSLIARLLTGLFLAGVYPPAMKMVATWFRCARGAQSARPDQRRLRLVSLVHAAPRGATSQPGVRGEADRPWRLTETPLAGGCSHCSRAASCARSGDG